MTRQDVEHDINASGMSRVELTEWALSIAFSYFCRRVEEEREKDKNSTTTQFVTDMRTAYAAMMYEYRAEHKEELKIKGE